MRAALTLLSSYRAQLPGAVAQVLEALVLERPEKRVVADPSGKASSKCNPKMGAILGGPSRSLRNDKESGAGFGAKQVPAISSSVLFALL